MSSPTRRPSLRRRPRRLRPRARLSDFSKLSLTPPHSPRGTWSDSAHYAAARPAAAVLPVLRARCVCGPGEAHNVALGCVRHLGCSAESGCLLLCLPSSLLPAALPVLPFTSPNFTPFFAAKNAATTTSVGRSVGRWTCVRRRGDGNYRLLGKFLRAPMNWGRESFKCSRDSRVSASGSVTWWVSQT